MEINKIEEIEKSKSTGGNTKAQSNQLKYWCFTFHNGDFREIEEKMNSLDLDFWIFSQEYGKSGDKPHLQGYLECKTERRWTEFKMSKEIHWENRKGNRENNIVYICKKEGQKEKPYIIDWNKKWSSSDNEYCTKVLKDYERKNSKKPIKVIDKDRLYDWQNEILSILAKDPCDRTLFWYYSKLGGVGKSSFCKYLAINHEALILSGKAADMKYAVCMWKEKHKEYPKIIILDIARNQKIHKLDYTGIEEIKNGLFFSSKYESEMVYGNNPHFICFANDEPFYEGVMEDRWVVKEIFKE